ncbi:MAG: ybeY, partial [Caulobacteraceae bacterium]|nr:ybeY [Caulobacteraceae bacterium]
MIEVEAEDEAWSNAVPDWARLCAKAAECALSTAPDRAAMEVAILLADDETVRDLNDRFRHKNAPTNVLSFPAHQTATGALGDIVLAFGVCAREAGEQGKPLASHLQHLVAHGVLHLLGYDHEDEADAQVMEDLERLVLKQLGLPDPYV